MPKAKRTFLQSDVTRAVRGLKEAGERIGGVRVTSDRTAVILTDTGAVPVEVSDDGSAELAAWKGKRRAG